MRAKCPRFGTTKNARHVDLINLYLSLSLREFAIDGQKNADKIARKSRKSGRCVWTFEKSQLVVGGPHAAFNFCCLIDATVIQFDRADDESDRARSETDLKQN